MTASPSEVRRAQGGTGDGDASSAHLSLFARFANTVAHASGRPVAFALCFVAIILWAVTGPIFHYSDTWQLVINTGTTIVTFLMVFLIQNTQNRDGAALQAKLDELILVTTLARNDLVQAERLSEGELNRIREDVGKAVQEGADSRPPP